MDVVRKFLRLSNAVPAFTLQPHYMRGTLLTKDTNWLFLDLEPWSSKTFLPMFVSEACGYMGNSNCLFRLSIAKQQAASLSCMHVGIPSLAMGAAPRVQQAPPPGKTLFINRSARGRCLQHMSFSFTAPLSIEPTRLTLRFRRTGSVYVFPASQVQQKKRLVNFRCQIYMQE